MKTVRILSVMFLATMSVISAEAATTGGSLAVTGTIVGSISMTIDSTGPAVTGNGTNTVSNPLGNFNRFGSAPAGTSISFGGSEWYLDFETSVVVERANLPGTPTYTLRARTATAAPAGIQFLTGNSTFLSTSDSVVDNNMSYGLSSGVGTEIVVQDSFTGGAIDNTIIYTATSN